MVEREAEALASLRAGRFPSSSALFVRRGTFSRGRSIKASWRDEPRRRMRSMSAAPQPFPVLPIAATMSASLCAMVRLDDPRQWVDGSRPLFRCVRFPPQDLRIDKRAGADDEVAMRVKECGRNLLQLVRLGFGHDRVAGIRGSAADGEAEFLRQRRRRPCLWT